MPAVFTELYTIKTVKEVEPTVSAFQKFILSMEKQYIPMLNSLKTNFSVHYLAQKAIKLMTKYILSELD